MLNCFGAVWIVEFIQVMIAGSLEVTQELVFILFLYSFPLPFFFNQHCLHFTSEDTEAQRRKGQPEETGLGGDGFGS